jgi:5'-3' exonuclease
MSNRPWVVVDTSYLAYRAHFGNPDLHWEDLHTEILFGFWEQLRVICEHEHIQSNRVVACCDSRSSFRRQAFSGYKANRREDQSFEAREEKRIIREQVRLLRDLVLPEVGVQVLHQVGLESDDLMAQVSVQLESLRQPEPAVLVTADGDLWQCIRDSIRWFDPARDRLYDVPSFIAKKGIHPALWGQVKCLAGCSSDTVPGIPKVGEVTAIKYLKGDLPSTYKTFQAIESAEGEAIFRRNHDLVVLPHKHTQPVLLRDPEWNVDAFFAMCKRYGFLSYIRKPMKGVWEDFFTRGKGQGQIKTRKRGQLR